jgi:hypothetical protein
MNALPEIFGILAIFATIIGAHHLCNVWSAMQ